MYTVELSKSTGVELAGTNGRAQVQVPLVSTTAESVGLILLLKWRKIVAFFRGVSLSHFGLELLVFVLLTPKYCPANKPQAIKPRVRYQKENITLVNLFPPQTLLQSQC